MFAANYFGFKFGGFYMPHEGIATQSSKNRAQIGPLNWIGQLVQAFSPAYTWYIDHKFAADYADCSDFILCASVPLRCVFLRRVWMKRLVLILLIPLLLLACSSNDDAGGELIPYSSPNYPVTFLMPASVGGGRQ